MGSLVRRLGLFDTVLIVMGSIIGSGIFRTPSVVAQRVHTPSLILAVWIGGGILAILGSMILAELAARRPNDVGAYAYLQEAFHPIVAFAFGWTSLVVSFTGGIAAAAVLFAAYVEPLSGLHTPAPVLAGAALIFLTIVNCLGVREGSNVQNAFMVLKIAAIGGLIGAGFFAHPTTSTAASPVLHSYVDIAGALGVAMVPVLFAYNGAPAATLIATETKSASRTLPMGLCYGMTAVVVLYVLVNIISVRVLGSYALARTATPASDVAHIAFGPIGGRLIAFAIVLSTLGFMSNRMLTAPRLYLAMAQNGLFFRIVGRIDSRTGAPVAAIVLQGILAIALVLSGTYERILNYVVSTTYVFIGLLALSLFVIRQHDRRSGRVQDCAFRLPWHPITTIIVLVASWSVAIDTYITYPQDGLIGLGILLSSVPVYMLWHRTRSHRSRRCHN